MDEGTHFAIIPNKALRDRRLTNGAFRLLGVLSSYLNQKGFCFPSMEKLAFDCNCTKRAIINQMKELQQLGYLEKRHMYNDNEGQTSNIYYIKYDEIPPEGVNVDSLGGERTFTGGSERTFTGGVNVDSPKVYLKEVYSFTDVKNNARAREALKEKKKDDYSDRITEEDTDRFIEIEREMHEVFSKSEMSYIRAVEFWKIDANKIHVYTATRFITEHLQDFDFESRFLSMESVRGIEFTFSLNRYNLPEEYYKLNKTA